MIQTVAAVTVDNAATTAPCPKCATTMVLAAVTHHPIATHMKRHTFLCAKCNQTKTYMLPASELVADWDHRVGKATATAH
jgi:hypothetical protein